MARPGSMCWSWPVAVPWQPAMYVCAGEPSVLVHSPDGEYSSPQLDPVQSESVSGNSHLSLSHKVTLLAFRNSEYFGRCCGRRLQETELVR